MNFALQTCTIFILNQKIEKKRNRKPVATLFLKKNKIKKKE